MDIQSNLFDEFEFLEDTGISKDNTLYNWCLQNGERGQLLIEEWSVEKNINSHGVSESMTDITYGSSTKKYWWTCRLCGDDFQMPIANRTIGRQGCPNCSKKRGGRKNHKNALENGNDLKTWCEQNGEYGKVLMNEWETSCNLEQLGINISDVSIGVNCKVYWRCSRCKEVYKTSVGHRVRERSGCPHCNRQGTSYPEQFLYRGLKQIFPDTQNRVKLFGNIEYDIYIPSKNFCIEYGSARWHLNKKDRDDMKRKLCEANGIRLMSIESHNRKEDSIFSDSKISYKVNYSKQHIQLTEILEYILNMLGHSIEEVNIHNTTNETEIFMFDKVENNIKELFPMIVKEWDESLNNGMKPEYFISGSHKRIKWKCYKCKCIWELSIKERIRRKSSCGNCGYNIFDDKIHVHAMNQSKKVRFDARMIRNWL